MNSHLCAYGVGTVGASTGHSAAAGGAGARVTVWSVVFQVCGKRPVCGGAAQPGRECVGWRPPAARRLPRAVPYLCALGSPQPPCLPQAATGWITDDDAGLWRTKAALSGKEAVDELNRKWVHNLYV